jgi:Leucine-rich repeat (LRR) protein
MMLMVILIVFLHLPVHQMKEEERKCPVVCQCLNKTVAICKDLKLDGINATSEWKVEAGLEIFDFSGNKMNLNEYTLGTWKVFYLQSFNLSGNNILNITKFTFFGFSKLENLDLSRNNISEIDCEAFSHTPSMAVLRLRSNRLTELCPHTFSLLEHLWYLDLSNNMIFSIQPETLHNISVLEWLSLANNRLTEIHPVTLRLLCHLRHLDLSNNMISSILPETLHNISVLEWLSLANNNLTEIPPDTFSLLEHLRYLDLSNNMIFSIHPDTLHQNSVLEWLSLVNNRLTDIRLDIFWNQRTLSYVDLSGNNITKIEGEMFYRTRKLEIFLLSSNDTFEYNASASYKENELFYIDLSGNRIERLGSLTFSWNCLQSLRSRSFNNMEEKCNLSSAGNDTSKINEETCVSKIKGLNLSNNTKDPFYFEKYCPLNLTSIILCKVELLELKENCLSIFYDNSLNALNTSGALINLTDNAYAYECFLSQGINKTLNVTSLNCLSQGTLGEEKCKISEHNNFSTTVESFSENNKVPLPSLPENILIFGIYASSVFVAIVVVLIITHIVGKPEPDEFWWEDKLAKRNY